MRENKAFVIIPFWPISSSNQLIVLLAKGMTINDLEGGVGGNCPNEFIFSGNPFPYNFKVSQNLFFPGEGLSKCKN